MIVTGSYERKTVCTRIRLGLGLAVVKTLIRIKFTVGHRCEYELLSFILAPTAPTSLRLKDETHLAAYVRIFVCYAYFSIMWLWVFVIWQISIRFNRLNFGRDTRTGYWRPFYGLSSEASFRHWIWAKFSNRCQVLLLPIAMSPRELLIEKTCGRPMPLTLPAKLYSNTNDLTNNWWLSHKELQKWGVSATTEQVLISSLVCDQFISI